MGKKKCNFCGSTLCEDKKIDYFYTHQDEHLLVREMPAELCRKCGMMYYGAAALRRVEKRFFSIQRSTLAPDEYVNVPSWSYRESEADR